MKHNEFDELSLGEMEDIIDEYEMILDELGELEKKTSWLGIEFLKDEFMDEYMNDIDQMIEIVNEEEYGVGPSRSEMLDDYIREQTNDLLRYN